MDINHESRIERIERKFGKPIGYITEPCKECGRLRVELWSKRQKICEKCRLNQETGEYENELNY
jgi:hypothetical protein